MKFRALSYNIHKGFDHFGVRFMLARLKEALVETRANILLLQEVVGGNPKLFSQHQIIHESQFEFLADAVWNHHRYGKNAIFPNRHHGNAILSDYPFLECTNHNISTNRWEQRGILHAQIQIEGVTVHLFNTHLDLMERGRRTQVSRLVDLIHQDVPSAAPLILAGDFNDWTLRMHQKILRETNLQECSEVLEGRLARSFPSFFPMLSLDRIYSRGLKVEKFQVLTGNPWDFISDHLPLLVEFSMEGHYESTAPSRGKKA